MAQNKIHPGSSPAIRALRATVFFCAVLAILYIRWGCDNESGNQAPHHHTQVGPISPNETSEYCPQAQPLLPIKHAGLVKQLDAIYADEDFKLAAYKRLRGAVRVPCVVYSLKLGRE